MMVEASKNLAARTSSKEREQYYQLSWLLVVVAGFQRAKHQLPPEHHYRFCAVRASDCASDHESV